MGYKVCIMGASLETGNKGVSALATSIIKNIIQMKPDAEIVFLIGNRTPKLFDIELEGRTTKAQIINYRLSPKAKFQEHLFAIFSLAVLHRMALFKFIREGIVRSNAWLRALQQADLVCNIHGGDSFSDIYGIRRFIVDIIDDIVVLLMKKNLILLPQTYGPYNHFISRLIASFIVNHSSRIYSRDLQSADVFKKVLRVTDSSPQVLFCPDVAFTLDSRKRDLYHVEPPIETTLNFPLVGLNVNGLMYNGGYNRQNMFNLKCDYKLFLSKLIQRFMESTPAHILFIPHTFGPLGNINSDPDACRDLLRRFTGQFKNRIHMMEQEYDQSEIKGLIGCCDFFIGSRMHACIAALSQEIPTVGLAYSRKFLGVFESVGSGDMVIDSRLVGTDEAVELVFACFQKRNEMKVKLQKEVSSAKNLISATFSEMLSE